MLSVSASQLLPRIFFFGNQLAEQISSDCSQPTEVSAWWRAERKQIEHLVGIVNCLLTLLQKTTTKHLGGHSFTASRGIPPITIWIRGILLPAQNTKRVFMNLLMQINAFINVDLAPVHLGFTHVVDYSDSAAATPLRLERQNLLCCFYASPSTTFPTSLLIPTQFLSTLGLFFPSTRRSARGATAVRKHTATPKL